MNDNAVPVRPAATLVLLRDTAAGPEVFLLKRDSAHVFAASAYVYPGGAVEPADREARLLAHYDHGAAARAESVMGVAGALGYWAAASRECFEEAGVLVGCTPGKLLSGEALASARDELNAGAVEWCDLVEHMELRFDTGQLHYFAHWTTPPGMPKRFSTRFFAARMPEQQRAAADGAETTHGEWLRPAAALDNQKDGEIKLWPPTLATLRQLSEYGDTDRALADLATREVVPQ